MNDPLASRARVTPDRTALVDEATGDAWDFAALDGAVERVATRLAAHGVEAGDHLGLVLPPRPASVEVVHAALRVGAVLVPLSHRLTPPELATRIEGADVTMLVCGDSTAETAVAAADVPVISVEEVDTAAVTALSAVDRDTPAPRHDWRLDEPALLAHTSGTTGEPKAVVLTAGNLAASAVASSFRLGLDPDDRWLVTLPLHHVGGLSPVLRMPLYGSTVVLRRTFEPGPTADDIDEYGVTCVSLVPTMLRRMLESRGTLGDSLRAVLLGGAPAPADLIERCRNYSVPVYPTYGMTEAASQIATATPPEAYDDPSTVGRPLLCTDLTVVDGEGQPLPHGETGEFVVDGPTVSPGYYDAPDATAAAYTARGLRTGDAGYVDDAGRVHVLNRLDERIVTGGENVDPGEVVAALRAHPAVADAAVVGLDDPEWGERVAALVARTEATLTADAVEGHLRERLAGFKLPRVVGFVEELPRTDSGTVDRAAARKRLRAVRTDPAPDERTDRTPGGERTDGRPEPTPAGDDRSDGDGEPDAGGRQDPHGDSDTSE
jgi:O-succinylbenzoic acid--CoA ligase